MAKAVKKKEDVASSGQRKAYKSSSLDGREKQCIALAVNLAEEQLRNGTASAQVITHYLKLGTKREQIEVEIKEKEKELIAAKTEALKSAKRVEELYANALDAMRRYGGGSDDDEDYEI